MIRKRRRRLGSVFGRAGSNSSSELEEKGLQRALSDLSVFFLGRVKGPHGRDDNILTIHRPLVARNRDLSQEDFTKKAARGFAGTFHFFKKSENFVKDFCAVSVKILHLSRKTECVMGKETIAELFMEWGLVKRSACEVYQHQRDLFVRQLFSDANKIRIALMARSETSKNDGGNT